MKKPKIAMIYTCWGNNKLKRYTGVGYYRVIKPAQYLSKWYDIDIIGKDFDKLGKTTEEIYNNLFKNYDMVITKAVDNPVACSALCFFADRHKKPLVLDLDDNFFTVRKDQPGYQWYHQGSNKRAIMGAYISMVNHIFFSTKPLADYHKDFIKRIFKKDIEYTLLPNLNDIKDFDYKSKRDGDKIIIGWQGSTTHFADLALVLPALKKIMLKYKNVYLEFLGGIEKEQVKALFKDFDDKLLERIEIKGGTIGFKDYPKLLAKQKWDIGICPLINDQFNRSKSHIKWMEYANYKIPSVASKTFPYYKDIDGKKTIEHEKTGYLAKNTREWVGCLSKLIKDKELREEIGNNAYEYVVNNWQYENNIYKYKKAIDKILKQYAI